MNIDSKGTARGWPVDAVCTRPLAAEFIWWLKQHGLELTGECLVQEAIEERLALVLDRFMLNDEIQFEYELEPMGEEAEE